MIKVLLLSCDAAVRFVLARLLEAEPDVCVSEDPGFDPDVVVMKLRHPEQAEEARRQFPGALLLAMVSALREDLRASDVDAVLDSVAPYEQLLATIRSLAARRS